MTDKELEKAAKEYAWRNGLKESDGCEFIAGANWQKSRKPVEDDLRAQLAEKDEEINLLKAKLEVCNDSRLRTYDGMAQKADVFDKLQSRHDRLREALEWYANKENWKSKLPSDPQYYLGGEFLLESWGPIAADKNGGRAREALSKDKADEVSGG